MIYALNSVSDTPEYMLILAQLSMKIWIEWKGSDPPTAAELGCIMHTQEDWETEIQEHWDSCSSGRDYSAEFISVAQRFWATLRILVAPGRAHIVSEAVRKVLSAREGLALLKAERKKLARNRLHMKQLGAVIDHIPVEVRQTKYRPPGQQDIRKNKVILNKEGLSTGESFLLWLCMQATTYSKHYAILQHQAKAASEHFPSTWRNLIGNLLEAAIQALIHSWRRWKKYVLNTPSQWEWKSDTEALFDPSAGILAHYAGIRSLGGPTAASGAMAGLWRLTVALGLSFPFKESGAGGWNLQKLRQHTVQPKIPFEVAQLVHFDYVARTTSSPFILIGCASAWFAFSGMCRDAHIQRSFLLKECSHGWLFHCIRGKDRSKPYDWVLPSRTISGNTVSTKIMEVVRAGCREDPWLLSQWGPCTTNPLTGTYWRNTPLSPTQMKEIRLAIMALPPLASKIKLDCCSYAARRAGSGVLGFLNASSILRLAFGNWKDSAEKSKAGTAMPDNYTENKLQLSYASKYLVNESIRLTIEEVGSANFNWGQVTRQIHKTQDILKEASEHYSDIILPHRESDYAKAGLTLELDARDIIDKGPEKPKVSHGSPKEEKEPAIPIPDPASWETKWEEPEEAEGSESSSSAGSEADDEEQKQLEVYLKWDSIPLVSGSASTSYIHTVDKSKDVREGSIGTGCNARPREISAQQGTAIRFKGSDKRLCPRCTADWPLDVVQRFEA